MYSKPYITAGELAEHLNCATLGDKNKKIYGIALYRESNDNCLSYVPYDKISKIENINAGVILTRSSIGLQLHRNYVVTRKDPYFYLADTIQFMIDKGLYCTETLNRTYISKTADISNTATISNGSVISDNVQIMHGVYIGKNVRIGKNCIIGANTVIGDNTIIEDGVIIGACCCIGTENFEYCKNNDGWTKIPVIGDVHIENDVIIGGNVVVEKGTIGTTVIGAYTEIENLVQVGHEVKIGKHCHIVACVAIAGWAEIGNHVDIYGQAAISNVKIGDNAVLMARTGADKNIQGNTIVSGFPAQEHKKELQFKAFLRKLFRDKMKGCV